MHTVPVSEAGQSSKMKLTVICFEPCAFNGLAPAPNVRESERIADALQSDMSDPIVNLDGAVLTVLDNHRGALLYCSGGATVHRTNPSTIGGNGYTGMPTTGAEERVIIVTTRGEYSARVRFE